MAIVSYGAGGSVAVEAPPLQLPYAEYEEPAHLQGSAWRAATLEEVMAWWGQQPQGEATCSVHEPFACGPDLEVGVPVETSDEQPTDVPFPSLTGYRSACRYYSDTYYTCCYYNDQGRMTQCYEYSKSCYRSNGKTYCYYRAREYYCGG